ncbi:MAG: C10 family peptidase, partial [Flavobacteriales bacterium]
GGGSSPHYHRETVVSRYSQAEQKGPLLTTYWKQRDPFNRQCPIIDGRRALAGCTAIAIGQIINYHRRDAHKYYDWSEIQDTTHYPNAVATFIHDIGMAVHMKYGSHGSRTSPDKAAHYFSGAGYYAHLRSYNYEICKADIDRGNPVYLAAKYKRKGVYFIIRWAWKYESGHAWVADGYKSITDYRKVKVEDGRDTYYRDIAEGTTNYIHMNWGWGPGTDSWCTYDYFKGQGRVYKYKKEMISF